MARRSDGIWLAFWLPASLGIHAAAFAWTVHVRAPSHIEPAPEPESPAVLTGGETFDIDPGTKPAEESAAAANEFPANETTNAEPGGETKSVPPRQHASHADHASSGKLAKSATETPTEVFGADGDRSAVDLASAFTRAFPQTASADAAWSSAPLGSAGAVDVVLEIDGDGNLIRTEVLGSGSPTLRRGVERTIVLLEHRLFTAHARTTRLRVTAVISPDATHDGLHGDVFALGGSFSATEGDAFFALSIGRRIDVRIVAR
ncbi:MAG: hypothetical protein ABI461_10060 [Polyangiaceae bacterium]